MPYQAPCENPNPNWVYPPPPGPCRLGLGRSFHVPSRVVVADFLQGTQNAAADAADAARHLSASCCQLSSQPCRVGSLARPLLRSRPVPLQIQSYLVRESLRDVGDFSISFRVTAGVKHFKIIRHEYGAVLALFFTNHDCFLVAPGSTRVRFQTVFGGGSARRGGGAPFSRDRASNGPHLFLTVPPFFTPRI